MDNFLYMLITSRFSPSTSEGHVATCDKATVERPARLAACHEKLDAAVAAAHGFPPDLPDDQILEKLLELNLAAAKD